MKGRTNTFGKNYFRECSEGLMSWERIGKVEK